MGESKQTAPSFPGPPWRIRGPAVVIVGLVDVELARAFVPARLDIVPVRRNRTLAATVVADYREGSTLSYSELSVMPAVVRRGARVGAWISSIWVDDEASLHGGREMWGVPKQLATFKWGDDAVWVSAEDGPLLSASWTPPRMLWPMPGLLQSFGSVDGDLRSFSGGGISRMAPTRVDVDVADEAEFAQLWRGVEVFSSLVGTISLRFGRIRLLAP